MWLSIANRLMEVDCPPHTALILKNLQPFIVPDGTDSPHEMLFRMAQRSPVNVPDFPPVSEEHINGRDITIWRNEAEGYVVRLVPPGSRRAFHLKADVRWHDIRTDLSLSVPEEFSTLNDFLMLAFTYSAAFARTVLVHASCVAVGDEGAAFIGQSGAGKSTHSRLWLRHVPGCRLLNDDQPAVQISPVGEIRIFGTPWSGKTPCYRQDSARLMAFFRMRQAVANRLVRPAPIEAFRLLLESASMIGRDSHTFEAITRTLAEIASRVPVYVLENRPEEAAVRLSSGQVFASKPLR